MSGSQFGINYIINVTTQNLEAVDSLYRSLKKVQELAKQGADFSVRIEKNGLDGIKDAVAKAVGAGIAAGGNGRLARTGGTRTEEAAGDPVRREKLDQLLRNMAQLTQAINGLSARTGTGGSGARSYPGDVVRDVTSSTRVFDDIGINSEITKSSRDIHKQRRIVQRMQLRLQGAQELIHNEISNSAKEVDEFDAMLREARMGARVLPKGTRRQVVSKLRELSRNRKLFGDADAEDDRELHTLVRDMEELRDIVARVKKKASDEIGALNEAVQREKQQLYQLLETQGGRYDARRAAQSHRRESTGYTSGGGGFGGPVTLTFDKAALEAAFESAAVKFAERTLQIWDGNIGPSMGIGGGRPSSGPGSYGTSGGGSQHEGPIPCTRCGGTGVFQSRRMQSICMRCGGTGIENMPNMAVIQKLSASQRQFGPGSATGSVPAQHISGFTPAAAGLLGVEGPAGPVNFVASMPSDAAMLNTPQNKPPGYDFIPHSVARRDKLQRQIKEYLNIAASRSAYVPRMNEQTGMPEFDQMGRMVYLSTKTGKPLVMDNLNMNERPVFYERLQQMTDEYERGGILHPTGNAHKFVRNGMLVTSAEIKKMAGGGYEPTMAGPGTGFNAGDPMMHATANANALLESFNSLNRVDLSHVTKSFEFMASNLAILKNDLQSIAPLLHTGTAEEIRVRALERENAMRKANKQERLEERKQRIQDRDDARALTEQRVQRELMRRDQLMRDAGGLAYAQPQRLFKALGSSLRSFSSHLESADVLRQDADLLQSRGSLNAASAARKRAADELVRMEVQSGRAISRAERLAILDPRFADLAGDIAGYRTRQGQRDTLDQASRRAFDIYGKMQEVRDNPQLSRDQQRIRLAMLEAERMQYMGTAAGLMSSGGMGPHLDPSKITPAQLHAAVTDQNKALEEQQGHLTKIVGKRYENVQLAEREKGLLMQFGEKFKSLTMYLAAGGVLYTALNVLRTGLTEAVRFEQDLAELQGVFVSKTVTDRNTVGRGVMDLSYQYGIDRGAAAQQAKLFAQTGASPQATLGLTSSALLATKGAGLDPAQATEMMIAVQNLSNGRVSPADIIDRISRIEARYPVTAQDLSTGIQRVGAVATEFQPQLGTMDQFDVINGMITSIISKTRMTGSQAATGLRFLLARLNAPEVQRHLQQQFDIKLGGDNPGQLRPMTDIFGDVAGKYNKYLQGNQSGKAAALLTSFAGARQANLAAALFDNWKQTMDIARESSLAFGDAQRRLSIQMETLATKVHQTQNAFLNFMTVLLEKTPLMGMMKGAVSAAGGGFQFLANHPVATTFGAAVGTGILGQLLASAGGAAGGGIGLGLGATGYALGGGAAMLGLASGYMLGNVLNAKTFIGRLNGYDRAAEEDRLNDMYGPAKYDRETYRKSEQGKAFADLAKSYGFSDNAFYERIAGAVQDAQKQLAGDPRFAGKGDFFNAYGASATNPKLFNAMNDVFMQKLGVALPLFDTKSPEAKTQSMELLRNALQFGNVAYNVQASDFVEKANNGRQSLATAFGAHHGLATLPPELQSRIRMGYAMKFGDASEIGGIGIDSPFVRINPLDIGFEYNSKMSKMLKHDSISSQFLDAVKILNAFDSEMGVGTTMAGLQVGGKNVLKMAMDRVAQGSENLGQALDALAKTILSTEEGQAKLQAAIGQQLDITYRKAERDQTAADGTPKTGDGVSYAGGVFARKYLEAYDKAVKAKIDSGAYDAKNPAVQAMLAFSKAYANPQNRQSMELDIAGAMNGINVRAVLADRLMNPLFSYAQRGGTITAQERIFQRAGLSFDSIGARAEAAKSFLSSIAETEGAMPVDAMKATNEYKLAIEQAKGFGIPLEDLFSEEERPGRNMIDPKVLKNMRDIVKHGGTGFSDTQATQLKLKAEVMKKALKDFASSTEEIPGMLDADQKKLLYNLINISDPVQALLATMSQQDQLETMGFSATRTAIGQEHARDLADIRRMGSGNRALAGIAHAGDMAQAAASFGMRMASVQSNPFQAYQFAHEGISSRYATAYDIAAQERDNATAAARSKYSLGSNELESEMTRINETFQGAIQKAYQDAQLGMVNLLNDTRVKYAEMQEQHLVGLVQQSTEGFKDLLTNPERLSYRWYDALVGPLAKTFQGNIADSFINNLVGPDGLFGDQAKGLFKSDLFQQASIIKMAHIEGITEGMRAAYGSSATATNNLATRYVSFGGAKGVMPVIADPVIEAAKRQLAEAGITTDQRKAYSKFSDTLYNDIQPNAYDVALRDGLPKVLRDVASGRSTPNFSEKKIVALRNRASARVGQEDAWRLYLGLPQVLDTFGISDYRPSNAKDSNKVYFKINGFDNILLGGATFQGGQDYFADTAMGEELKQYYSSKPPRGPRDKYSTARYGEDDIIEFLAHKTAGGKKYQTSDDTYGAIMRNYQISSGKDRNGAYLAYYDKYDFDVPGSGMLGKPYEIYDRVYYDPKTFRRIHPETLSGGVPPMSARGDGLRYTQHPIFGYVKSRDEAFMDYLRSPDSVKTTPSAPMTWDLSGLHTAEIPETQQFHTAAALAKAEAREQVKEAAKQQAAFLVTQMAVSQIAMRSGVKTNGVPSNYGSEGATLGGVLGNFLPIPFGSEVGSLVGGFLGSRFGKGRNTTETYEALQKIERNTRETITVIQNQTAVLSLNNRLLNVPSTFHVPSYSIQGGGGASGSASNQINYHGDITINVDGSKSPTETAKAVMTSLKEDRRTRGTFVSKIGSRT